MLEQFIFFEDSLELSDTQAAVLLGLDIVKYDRFKHGRILPKNYILFSMQNHSCLSATQIKNRLLVAYARYNIPADYHQREYLLDFQSRVELNGREVSQLLGVYYKRYHEFRTGDVPLQRHLFYSIEVLQLIHIDDIHSFFEARRYAGEKT